MLRISTLTCLLMFVASQDTRLSNDDVWADYELKFHKQYTESEERSRRSIFEGAMAKIRKHNLEADMGLHSYWQGETTFTDWTLQEFETKMNGDHEDIARPSNAPIHEAPHISKKDLPERVDWSERGYVTRVKFQGSCASCWAFAATGALEAQMFAKTGKLVPLSEQHLVDCSQAEGNMGCEGGWASWAFEYILGNNGISTEQCYPYQDRDQACNFDTSCIGATITGYKDVKYNDELALQDAIAKIGPITVAIDADHESFQNYKRGVYDEPECSSTDMNHAVLVVGYGVENGKEYYIVKNSYGTNWGMDGYVWMSRNKDNQCGIAKNATYPIV